MMVFFLFIVCGVCKVVDGDDSSGYVNMYRLYQPSNREHFYTASKYERDILVSKHSWKYEGIGWVAPKKSSTPVFRLYNPVLRDHHYTASKYERDVLVDKNGWKYEGIGWYSSDTKRVPLYRLFNPDLSSGSHNYTASQYEKRVLIKRGWKYEGIAWYGYENIRTSVETVDYSIPAQMTIGKTVNPKVKILPTNATNKSYQIKSSNSSIIKISKNKLIPKRTGKVIISIIADNGKYVKRIVVQVKRPNISLVKIESPKAVINEGESKTIKIKVSPSEADQSSLKWISLNPKIATVTKTGKVYGKSGGTTKLSVSAPGVKKKYISVSVRPKTTIIKTSYSKLGLIVGGGSAASKSLLDVEVGPSNSFDKTVSFTSSNPDIVTVNSSGLIRVKGVGNAQVILKTNGATKKIQVRVSSPASYSSYWTKKNRLSAHRGAEPFAPENSIGAFEYVVNKSYGAVELDPRESSDGKVVLVHDKTTERTMNASKVVGETSYSELKKLKFKTRIGDFTYTDKQLNGQYIPLLSEALAIVNGEDILVNVDGSKMDFSDTSFTDKVIQNIDKYGNFKKTTFFIPNESQRKAFARKYRSKKVAITWQHPKDAPVEEELYKYLAYDYPVFSISAKYVNKKIINTVQSYRIPINVYGVNDIETYKKVAAMNVTMIETDKLTPQIVSASSIGN